MRSRKAQLYGISAFLYALAIAIILIVGMLGLSKDFEAASQAGFFRFSAISATKNAEMFKKLLDQERGYAVDKSLFVTGAFGGYSIQDLICKKNCVDGTCPEGSEATCYPEIIDSSGNGCGRKDLNIPHIAEKYLPYWRSNSYTCIPSFEKVMETFSNYAGKIYATPNERVLNALTAGTMYPVYFNYYLDFNLQTDVDVEKGIIQTRWIPVGQEQIIIATPPDNPVIEYKVKPYVHLFSKTRFFDVYEEAKNFVKDEYFEDYLRDPQYSPIPSIIDKDQSVVKHYSNGEIKACKCTNTQFDSNGDGSVDTDLAPGETCKSDTSLCKASEQPFKVLVDYIKNNPDLYPNEEPNLCNFPNSVSDIYSGSCKVHTNMTDEGKLNVTSFSGDCSTTSNDDNNAMKCVLKRIINRMNKELLSKPVEKNVASLYWGAQIKAVDSNGNDLTGDLYSKRLQHVIDGKKYNDYYDGSYGFGYVNWNNREAMIIELSKEYNIDTFRIYLWNKDNRYYRYKIEGSRDGSNWFMLVNATIGEHRNMEQWNITPTVLKYIKINGTYNSKNNGFHIVEFEAFADIEYRYLISSFDLEYAGSRFSNMLYNATDLDSGEDAPRFVANPDPKDCTDASCGGTTYCANFPGESCPCCGQGFGGPGLSCCTADYADSSYKNRCWEDECIGRVHISVNPTYVKKCSSVKVSVTGLCNYCSSKTATISWTGCGSGSVITDTFGEDGGVVKSITFTEAGTCTITAEVDINGDGDTNDNGEKASTKLEVTDCGKDGMPACDINCANYYNGCASGTARAPSTFDGYTEGNCYTCGGDNEICCDNIGDGAQYDNNRCNTGYCSGGNTPKCVPCGTKNQPQCPYNKTGMYDGCYDTSPPLAPENGICRECGYADQICCDNEEECDKGYYCASSGKCESCGGGGQPCCPGYENGCYLGYVCNATTNTCVKCGKDNQPCCIASSIEAGPVTPCDADLECASDGTCQRCNNYCPYNYCDGTMCSDCTPTSCSVGGTCESPDVATLTCNYNDWCDFCYCDWCDTYTCTTTCSPDCSVCGNELDNPQ